MVQLVNDCVISKKTIEKSGCRAWRQRPSVNVTAANMFKSGVLVGLFERHYTLMYVDIHQRVCYSKCGYVLDLG